jgi:DNA-binding MarR family transcriptional regulator
LEPQQHQLLLALRGFPAGQPVTIGDLAERLLLHHHSTGELIDRSARQGYVERERDEADRRRVLIRLTPTGEAILRELSVHHRAELRSAGPALAEALTALLAGTETGMANAGRTPG